MLDMDLPDQTTKEYQEPVIAPKVAAALKDALRDEDEIEVDASHLDYSFGLGGTSRSSSSLRKPSSRYQTRGSAATAWNNLRTSQNPLRLQLYRCFTYNNDITALNVTQY